MAIDRLKRLIEAIRHLTDGEFSGYIRINFTQGSIGRIEKFEEIEDAAAMCPQSDGLKRENKYEGEGHKK